MDTLCGWAYVYVDAYLEHCAELHALVGAHGPVVKVKADVHRRPDLTFHKQVVGQR